MNADTKKPADRPNQKPNRPTLVQTPGKPVEVAKTSTPATTPAADAKQDQKGVSTPQDQKGAPEGTVKKARKKSKTHQRWEELDNFKPEQRITINPGNPKRDLDTPKRGKGAARFALYRDGMTVAEYLAVTKEKGIPGALANADIRWDAASGWITVK